MLRVLVAVACGYLVWTNPQARNFTSNFLRGSADFIDQQTERDLSIGQKIDRLLGNRR